MQSEYHFESGNMMGEDEEIVVDIRDAIYTLLRRWPLLLVGMLCGVLLLGAFSVWRGRQLSTSEKSAGIEDRIVNAREGLGEARAAEIEGMYTQYQEYIMLQSLLRDQYVEYMRDIERVDKSYVKTLKFLCTGEDVSPSGIFEVQTVLGEEECREIGMIISGETNTKKAAILSRNRVYISVDNNSKLAVSSEEILPIRYILTLRIVGEYKSQCDQIQTVIERKMMNLQQAYVDAGGVMEMTLFASEYTNDVASFMKDAIATLSGQMRNVTDNLYYFQQNTIDKLDNDSKTYYELLQEQGRTVSAATEEETDEQENDSQPVSWKSLINKKYIVFGALAGFILMALLILLQYVLTHEVQSKESFVSLYGIPISGVVCKTGSSSGLQMVLYKLFHTTDELTPGKSAAMAQDMGIELEKKDARSVYLLLSDDTEALSSFAKTLIDNIHSQRPNLTISCGDPLNDQEQMKALSNSDAAVLLVGLKKTRREDASRQLQMCGRYQVPVMGVVTLEVV